MKIFLLIYTLWYVLTRGPMFQSAFYQWIYSREWEKLAYMYTEFTGKALPTPEPIRKFRERHWTLYVAVLTPILGDGMLIVALIYAIPKVIHNYNKSKESK